MFTAPGTGLLLEADEETLRDPFDLSSVCPFSLSSEAVAWEMLISLQFDCLMLW